MESESVAHVLWQCGVAQDIWAGSIRKIQKSLIGHSDFNQLVAILTQRLTEEELSCSGYNAGQFGINGTWSCMEENYNTLLFSQSEQVIF